MNGIALIYDPDGTPAVLTLDLKNLDPVLRPLVDDLLSRIQEANERAEWRSLSHASLNRAYGDNEPDYTVDDLIERNPNYRPE